MDDVGVIAVLAFLLAVGFGGKGFDLFEQVFFIHRFGFWCVGSGSNLEPKRGEIGLGILKPHLKRLKRGHLLSFILEKWRLCTVSAGVERLPFFTLHL
ncbi:MAG: hypothetical protein WCY25_10445 [Moheibacter sp.]